MAVHVVRPRLVRMTVLLLVTLAVGALSFAPRANAQTPPLQVTITDLGPWAANDINDLGQIVGSYSNGRAVLWQNGSVTDLGTLPEGFDSAATGINNHGQVIGHGSTNSRVVDDQIGFDIHAFFWQHGSMTDLGTLAGDFNSSFASAINDQGQVVGGSDTLNESHAFLWQNGSMTDLGTLAGENAYYATSGAADINDQGQVVGGSTTDYCRIVNDVDLECDSHAFLWQNGVMTDLGTLGGRTAPPRTSTTTPRSSAGATVRREIGMGFYGRTGR